MWQAAVISARSTEQWCSVEDAEIYLRTDGDPAEVPLLEGMIAAAGEQIEAITGINLVPRTVDVSASSFHDLARIPVAPIRQIVSISYVAPDGSSQVFDPAAWRKIGTGLDVGVAVRPGNSWPNAYAVGDAVNVTIEVGYESSALIPAPLRQACFLLLGDFYLHREDSGRQLASIPNGVMTLVSNYRRFS